MERTLAAISNIDGYASLDGKRLVEAILYGLVELDEWAGVQPSGIREVFDKLHIAQYSRINQYLSENSKRVRGAKPRLLKSKQGYRLESDAKAEIADLFPTRPTKRKVAKHLVTLATSVSDAKARNYLEEAIGCFTHDYWRAAVVMTWCLAYDLLRTWVLSNHLPAINARLATRKTPLVLSTIEDFEGLGERDLLDTLKACGVLSKEAHKTFVQLLDDRNSYAHPSGKPITASIAEAFIEKVILQALPYIT